MGKQSPFSKRFAVGSCIISYLSQQTTTDLDSPASMHENAPFGAQLYAALRDMDGYETIAGIFNYDAIQQLKKSDRTMTARLFNGSSYEFLQRIKTGEPEEIVEYLRQQAEANQAGLATVIALTVAPN